MTEIAELILRSGRAGVELALFVLLPIMIVMLSMMRLLEARGILDRIVDLVSPLLKPLGVPGLGVFALLQTTLVSFAAPMATLAMMDKGDTSRRHIAATFAMVLGAAQANVVFPMAAFGLHSIKAMLVSMICALVGAACTYHFFARALPEREESMPTHPPHATASDTRSTLHVINGAGKEAFDIAVGAIPMLVLALLLVNSLRSSGVIDLLESGLAPLFTAMDLPSSLLLPIITKYIAGGTAMMGVTVDFMDQGLLSIDDINRVSGFLISPLDIAGVAILVSAGSRVAGVVKPAIFGALVAIALRSIIHFMWP